MFGYWKKEAVRQHKAIVILEDELEAKTAALHAVQQRAGRYATELEELEQIREDEVNELKAQRQRLNETIADLKQRPKEGRWILDLKWEPREL